MRNQIRRSSNSRYYLLGENLENGGTHDLVTFWKILRAKVTASGSSLTVSGWEASHADTRGFRPGRFAPSRGTYHRSDRDSSAFPP